ncbi:hypothetical protein CEUSTIGMA_g6600.t1 [Chlamydomonas eustigma]|uniref:GIY-YIG domain-containing protein n=1 Tax=Chlamydomonas eustigma TaxID=1157962 RepID=A0A250X8R1_9CHLO|nr:hypothetical protein CEUSTIGMA_g6600.t1 [Chlamydomonas eustigma]|eukprot:GAX79160.1 hypothetical protein CEUSTIGMA_g6600.t1 [Chlamydomonas eustigma]
MLTFSASRIEITRRLLNQLCLPLNNVRVPSRCRVHAAHSLSTITKFPKSKNCETLNIRGIYQRQRTFHKESAVQGKGLPAKVVKSDYALPRATLAVLQTLQSTNQSKLSISKLLESHGFKHETALKHLALLLQQDLLQENVLIRLHGLHRGSRLGLNKDMILEALTQMPRSLRGSGVDHETAVLKFLHKLMPEAVESQESRELGITILQIRFVKLLLKIDKGRSTGGRSRGQQLDVLASNGRDSKIMLPRTTAPSVKEQKGSFTAQELPPKHSKSRKSTKAMTRVSEQEATALIAARQQQTITVGLKKRRVDRSASRTDGCITSLVTTSARRSRSSPRLPVQEFDDGRHHHCYALYKPMSIGGRGVRTYIGYTVDPARRLKQHNGELAGGAKATRSGSGCWSFLYIIRMDEDTPALIPHFGERMGLSLEWYLKRYKRLVRKTSQLKDKPRPSKSEYQPIRRRIVALSDALMHPKFSLHAPHLVVYAAPGFMEEIQEQLRVVPHTIKVLPLASLPPAPRRFWVTSAPSQPRAKTKSQPQNRVTARRKSVN